MRIAAIDIGSNAIRLQVCSLIRYNGRDTVKNLEYLRFPLRLGQDVFRNQESTNGIPGSIRPETEENFLRLMQAYRILLDLYEVVSYRACATSAFRDASNGEAVAARVLKECGISIEILSGEEEAALISSSIVQTLDAGSNLHIDVGGGSTELNLYYGRQKIASSSFNLGSVRTLGLVVPGLVWLEVEQWIREYIKPELQPLTAIGTGGNIAKLYDLHPGKKKKVKLLTISELQAVHLMISRMSVEERIHQLLLNPDRADVIVPASEIYLQTMHLAKAKKILIPELGLKDGIIHAQYLRLKEKIPAYSAPE
jgi:exopolyphosphatase/guanosine-5'-triphosphate,3'-diphosphate pyrophosphatase